mgnify:CR=1 FL=1
MELKKTNKSRLEVDEITATGYKAKEGTNCWEENFPNAGLFHQWAFNYEESGAGFGNYTVAIIEMPDGTIQEALPTKVKFVDLPDY